MRVSQSFFMDFVRFAGGFWFSDNKKIVWRLTVILVGLTVLQIVMAVLVNKWNAALFDAIEQHSMSGLTKQIMVLLVIMLASILITVSHLTVKRRLMIDWRTWLTEKVTDRWMNDGRHYLVSHMPGEHDNPDERIAEDCRIATESAISLGHSLFYSCLSLISFTQILWSLSGVITVDFVYTFDLRGHLVWIAIVYAGLASWLGWLVGIPLTKATYANQTAEANFRSGLIDARENSQAIALIEAENFEKKRFRKLFTQIQEVWSQQTGAWQYILAFSTGYGLLSMAFPVLVSSPRYISGAISLGALMQSAQAFQEMASALSWPVNNLASIALWRASVERVLGLIKALDTVDEEIAKPEHHWIVVEQANKPVLALRDLTIAKLNGPVLASGINMEIQQGDHVLITGNTFTGAKLFRAIAQLRPWGSGRIELPNNDKLFFMPPRPHLPANFTLREAICYPKSGSCFTPEEIAQTLMVVGLKHLIEQLDNVDVWTRSLSRKEQQRLGMVRLLLNKPHWIFLQEAFDSLDAASEEQMLRLIHQHLPNATLLNITHLESAPLFHDKTLEFPGE